jgi:bifunctional DNase/RNase
MLIPVEVFSFAVNSENNAPLVILKEYGGARSFAVIIGPLEASAIAINSLNVVSEKPNTFRLLSTVINELGAVLEKAVIHGAGRDLYGRIHLLREGKVKIIDCRPGDAISIAIQSKSGLFVEENLLEKSPGDDGTTESEKLRATISNVDTVEFGSYYLE